jgi:hypothetical protein
MERAPTILATVAGKNVESFRCFALAQEGQGGEAASVA